MVNMNFLTPFQITTFVLGIVFSILTIAMVFFTLRHPNGYRNTFVKVLFTIILPMVTFIMWFACAFAAYAIFDSSELYIMLLSILCGALLSGLAFLAAWLINKYAVKKTTVDSKIEIYAVNRIEKKADKADEKKDDKKEDKADDKKDDKKEDKADDKKEVKKEDKKQTKDEKADKADDKKEDKKEEK